MYILPPVHPFYSSNLFLSLSPSLYLFVWSILPSCLYVCHALLSHPLSIPLFHPSIPLSIRKEFLEDEAELSGSEAESDEDDDLAAGWLFISLFFLLSNLSLPLSIYLYLSLLSLALSLQFFLSSSLEILRYKLLNINLVFS